MISLRSKVLSPLCRLRESGSVGGCGRIDYASQDRSEGVGASITRGRIDRRVGRVDYASWD
eukprot:3916574-Pyramimonas_sp.AAC.1